jgi:hypothetical protein
MPPELLLSAILMTVPLSLPAQSPPDTTLIEHGARLRVTVDSGALKRVIGVFVTRQPDSLWLRRDARSPILALPRSHIMTLEVSRGQGSCWRLGASLGMLLGIGVGALIVHGKTYQLGDNTPAVEVLASMGIGGIIGGVVGARVRRDRWEVLPRAGPERRAP